MSMKKKRIKFLEQFTLKTFKNLYSIVYIFIMIFIYLFFVKFEQNLYFS